MQRIGRPDMLSLERGDRKAPTTVNAHTLNSFLANRKWTVYATSKGSRTWVQGGGDSENLRVVRVPFDQSLVDYDNMLWEASQTVANLYQVSLPELGELATSINCDLFYVRVDKDSRDGTIPLKQGKALLESIEKMVRGAAVATHSPWSSGRGKTSATVKNFIESDVRMGHTKPGSFIITIAARLQQEELLPTLEPTQDVDPARPDPNALTESEEGAEPTEPTLDFSRRVMTTLSKSLDASRRHLASDETHIGLATAQESGMNQSLIEAIETIGSADGVSGVDLTFDWSESLPQDETVPDAISFSREEIQKIPKVKERLAKAETLVAQRVIGPVVELKRGLSRTDEEDEGDVVISAEVLGRVRRVTVSLSGSNYDWAIFAHQKHLPFVVLGDLSKKSQSWWITRVDRVETRELARFAREGSLAYLADPPEDLAAPPEEPAP